MLAFTLASLLAASPRLADAQQAITVTVNGQAVAFDQPPVEQGGRVFVPLRGVFERLGASVVYQDGHINATKGTHMIGLTIGSTAAVVDGSPKTLDKPPFTIAGRTLVPLRFISEALGATVDYNDATQSVNITSALPAFRPRARVTLLRLEPAAGGSSDRKRPEISASFATRVDPNTVVVLLDDRNVTPLAYLSDRSFRYVPDFDVPLGPHNVSVSGRSFDGTAFRTGWNFTQRPPAQANFLNNIQPRNGDRTGGNFTVSGNTRPGSRVSIVAVASARISGFEVNENAAKAVVGADRNGHFRAPILVLDAGSGVIDVRIESVAFDGGRAVRTIRLRP